MTQTQDGSKEYFETYRLLQDHDRHKMTFELSDMIVIQHVNW